MRFTRLLTLLVLAALSSPFPQGASALVMVGALETPYYPGKVDVVGDLAYVAAGTAGLRVIDVSDPAAPVELGAPGQLAIYSVVDVEVVGDLAYLTGTVLDSGGRPTQGRLLVVDVSDPANPVEVGVLEFAYRASDVEVVGDLAYVMDLGGVLHVIDVSDPAAPTQLGALEIPGTAQDLQAVGSLAYVAGYTRLGFWPEPIEIDGWLRVIDVSNPAQPVQLGAISIPDAEATAVDVVGNIAYAVGEALRISPGGVGYIGTWLRAIDVSDPASPVMLAALDLPDYALGIAVVEDFAYVADYAAGLLAIDVSDPTSPEERGILSVGAACKVEVAGNFAYVSDCSSDDAFPSGLRVIDISEPRFPAQIGALGTLGNPNVGWDLDVVGDLAYAVGAVGGFFPYADSWLRVVDVSDPTLPVELSVFEMLGIPNDVEVAGDLAYVGGGASFFCCQAGWLRVIDVSDPALPVALGALETPGAVADLEVVGNLVYMVGRFPGASGLWLRVIDVSNPMLPVELAALEIPPGSGSLPYDVRVTGDLAYVATSAGLLVIDISDPIVPVQIGALSAYGGLAVDVEDGIAYLGNDRSPWLDTIDVSDPTSPVHLSSLIGWGRGQDVEVTGDLTYVLDVGRVRVIEVSDPSAPVEIVGVYNRTGGNMLSDKADVEVVDGLIYMTDVRTGLRIIDLGPEYAQTISVDLDIKPGSESNAVNPSARGILPVAILGSDTFDVADVDATTLAFGLGEAAPLHSSGGHAEDVNDDGYTDWVSHYRIEEVAVAAGDTELCLTGATLDGIPIEGCDAIVTVPYVGERRRAMVNRQR